MGGTGPASGASVAGGGGSQAAPSARASSSPSLALCQTDSPPLADSAHQHGTAAERVDKGPRYTSSHLPSRKGSKATGGRVLLRPQPGKSRRFRGLICHRRTHRTGHRRVDRLLQHRAAPFVPRRSNAGRGLRGRSTCGYDGQGSRLAHIPTGSTTATGCDKKDFGSMIKQRNTP